MADLGAVIAWLRAVGAAELANLGVLFVALAGIGLTLLQLLLLRRQLKLEALIQITDSTREIVSLGFTHPVVWSVLDGNSATLLAHEALAQRRYLQLWTNHMQVMWAAWQMGLVSGHQWAAYRLDMAEFFRIKALREHWTKVAHYYPPGFQRLMVELSTVSDRNEPAALD